MSSTTCVFRAIKCLSFFKNVLLIDWIFVHVHEINTSITLIYSKYHGRSQNTVPIASTQVAIKGIVQYSTRSVVHSVSWLARQLATRHSREHTLSIVGPDAHVE